MSEKGGRGREGDPGKWTGQVPCLKRVIEANPDHVMRDSRAEDSQEFGSHRSPGRPEKPLSRTNSARTANRHW
jgi:hypothetical protein